MHCFSLEFSQRSQKPEMTLVITYATATASGIKSPCVPVMLIMNLCRRRDDFGLLTKYRKKALNHAMWIGPFSAPHSYERMPFTLFFGHMGMHFSLVYILKTWPLLLPPFWTAQRNLSCTIFPHTDANVCSLHEWLGSVSAVPLLVDRI